MKRIPFAVAVFGIALSTVHARADNIPIFSGVPDSYTAGQSFSFTIEVPETLVQQGTEQPYSLSDYSVNLLVTDGSATSTNLSATVSSPNSATNPTPNYVFSGQSSNFTSTTTPVTGGVSVQFSDSIDPSFVIPTSPYVNLGVVTVTPGADLTGTIEIQFGNGTSYSPTVEGFGILPQAPMYITQNVATIATPAPAGIVSLAFGGLVLAVGRLRRQLGGQEPGDRGQK